MKVSTGLVGVLRAQRMAASAASTAARGAPCRQHQTLGDSPRVMLCADFDETITQRDTIQLLFQLAGQAAQQKQSHAVLVQQLVDRYSLEMSAFLDASLKQNPSGQGCRRQDSHCLRVFDAEALDAFLEGYAATDWRSIERVIATRALGGFEIEKIREAGRSIALRDGCTSVLGAVPDVHVISTNWSAEMVRAAVSEATELSPGRVHVCANEMLTDESGVTTGEIAMVIQSPVDKAREVRRIRHKHERAQSLHDLAIVFIGDGVNDLLAMLEADVGISLQEAKHNPPSSSLSTLHGVAVHHGVAIESLEHLSSLTECVDAAIAAKASNSRVIFAAKSWADIARLIPTDRN